MTEKEKLERTIDKIHEFDMKMQQPNVDQDYIRADLHDADDEEFEDRIVEAART